MEKSTLYRHPAMRILVKAIRREVLFQIVATNLLLVFGCLLVLFQYDKSVFLTIIGLGAVVLSARLLWRNFPSFMLQNHVLYKVLYENPQNVVWVYSTVTQRMPFGLEFISNCVIYFHLMDGSHESVSLPSKKQKLVSKFLNRLLPHATFGFSEERQQQYDIDPFMLMRRKE
ncbi:MAG: hypothetical protein AAF705_03865 [Bacteroidota bacterium]